MDYTYSGGHLTRADAIMLSSDSIRGRGGWDGEQ